MQVTAEEFAQYMEGLLSLVDSGATVTVTRSGSPVAVIQPYPAPSLPYRTDPMGEDPSAPVLRVSP
jgi:antitoxin (DNA-binding transcriptional repressor) of toxin-antitoxin stability system